MASRSSCLSLGLCAKANKLRYIETKLLFSLDDRPTALFASSDLITLGALKAIDEENLTIPDDISLLSFDDFDFAPYLRCPLTVVRQPKELMGEVAVKLLVEQLGNPDTESKRVVLRPELVVRDSIAEVAVPEIGREDST